MQYSYLRGPVICAYSLPLQLLYALFEISYGGKVEERQREKGTLQPPLAYICSLGSFLFSSLNLLEKIQAVMRG